MVNPKLNPNPTQLNPTAPNKTAPKVCAKIHNLPSLLKPLPNFEPYTQPPAQRKA